WSQRARGRQVLKVDGSRVEAAVRLAGIGQEGYEHAARAVRDHPARPALAEAARGLDARERPVWGVVPSRSKVTEAKDAEARPPRDESAPAAVRGNVRIVEVLIVCAGGAVGNAARNPSGRGGRAPAQVEEDEQRRAGAGATHEITSRVATAEVMVPL